MPFKYDADGVIVIQEVNGQKLPVFVHADGKEAPFDADGTIKSIHSRAEQSSRVEAENKDLREKVKTFDGITNAADALKALEIVKGLDEKKLVDAGSRDKAIAEAVKSVRAEYEPIVKEASDLKGALYAEKIGGAFARSKFISDKIAVPVDMVQATFGGRFKVDNGKTVALDANGQPIFSRTRHGEPADFEEALEIMVDAYPYKANILKGSGASGGGATGSSNGAGGKTITRAQLEAMPPESRGAALKGVVLTD